MEEVGVLAGEDSGVLVVVLPVVVARAGPGKFLVNNKLAIFVKYFYYLRKGGRILFLCRKSTVHQKGIWYATKIEDQKFLS